MNDLTRKQNQKAHPASLPITMKERLRQSLMDATPTEQGNEHILASDGFSHIGYTVQYISSYEESD